MPDAPLAVIMWFRKMPSSRAPIRKIARARSLVQRSAFSSTRMQPSVSNACFSRRYSASVFMVARCQLRATHVQPISTR